MKSPVLLLCLSCTAAKKASRDAASPFTFARRLQGDDDDGLPSCLTDCNVTDDGLDCAGFSDVDSSCASDCDAGTKDQYLAYCATQSAEGTCASLLGAATTCADGVLSEISASLPADVVDHGTTSGGWCSGGVDDCSSDLDLDAAACWGLCAMKYGADLVAIDLADGECCCQDKCECMADVEDGNYVYTTSAITTLPAECTAETDDDDAVVIPATCADATTLIIEECRGPLFQQGCLNEARAYTECKWNAITALIDPSLSCALTCPASELGSESALASGPFLAASFLAAVGTAL